MRKIKFRGRRYNGDWVYGELCCPPNRFPSIRTYVLGANVADDSEVTPESVGQFTGLYDKNGKEIYEGDIVRKMCVKGYAGQYEDGEVVFRDGSFVIDTKDKWERFRYTTFDETEELNDGKCHWTDEYEFEVIGNIYDNPNLIKR